MNELPNIDSSDFMSPGGDSPLPPFEVELGSPILPYFELSGICGAFLGQTRNSDGAVDTSAEQQAVYLMILPKIGFDLDIAPEKLGGPLRPYIGIGLGATWYRLTYRSTVDDAVSFPGLETSKLVFSYAPSVGASVPIGNNVSATVDYRYLAAFDTKLAHNAGGHLFLIGLEIKFGE